MPDIDLPLAIRAPVEAGDPLLGEIEVLGRAAITRPH